MLFENQQLTSYEIKFLTLLIHSEKPNELTIFMAHKIKGKNDQ